MDISEIIEKYLKKNNYDGLYNSDLECGCFLNDLFPCIDYSLDCQPGYKRECKSCEDKKDCDNFDFVEEVLKLSEVKKILNDILDIIPKPDKEGSYYAVEVYSAFDKIKEYINNLGIEDG